MSGAPLCWAQQTDNASSGDAAQAAPANAELAVGMQIQEIARMQTQSRSASLAKDNSALKELAPRVYETAKQQPAPPEVDFGIVAWYQRAYACSEVIFQQVNQERDAEVRKRFDEFQKVRYTPMTPSGRPSNVAAFNQIFKPISRR